MTPTNCMTAPAPQDCGGIHELCSVAQLIDVNAQRAPRSTYFIATQDGREVSFAQLQRICSELGPFFARHGVRRGAVVSLFMSNGLDAAMLILAAMYHGMVINPINLLAQPSQLSYILDHSDTALVVTTPEHARTLQAMAAAMERSLHVEVITDSSWLDHNRAAAAKPGVMPAFDDAALLMYTSGTTGTPKGVVLSHGNLVANGIHISREHGLGSDDRGLAPLPLYHINALVVNLIAPLVRGGSLVMPPKFSATTFWKDAISFNCTWVNAVPTIIAYLIQSAPKDLDLDQLRRIRFCRSASAALPPEHHRAFERRFGVDIIETMGLTETAAPSFSNPIERHLRKVGSIGKPSGTEARVVDAQGHVLPNLAIGEIELRGLNVMRGYLKNDTETAKAFTADGWFRTGDLGYRDDDGYYFITGRAKELIIKGGENISPREIDEALLRYPAVMEAATIGVKDSNYGQNIEAYLVLRDGAAVSANDLRAHCLEHLGKYKMPRVCYVVDDLPRGPTGKIQRLKLHDLESSVIKESLHLY